MKIYGVLKRFVIIVHRATKDGFGRSSFLRDVNALTVAMNLMIMRKWFKVLNMEVRDNMPEDENSETEVKARCTKCGWEGKAEECETRVLPTGQSAMSPEVQWIKCPNCNKKGCVEI